MSGHKYFPPSVYVSFSELKDGETFTFRYGDREHRFTDHIYIFEGDIVDILTENEERGVITYENGGFVVKASTFVVDFMSNINGEDVEVLGNIVDNPELLG